jgi:hypothetical protein
MRENDPVELLYPLALKKTHDRCIARRADPAIDQHAFARAIRKRRKSYEDRIALAYIDQGDVDLSICSLEKQ